MPTRLVREGILSSEAVCSLSWPAEVLYRRLMSVVDDYGRFPASTKLIRSKCYPLQFDRVTHEEIVEWIRETVRARLVVVYPATDASGTTKLYLEIQKFGQTTRSKSKCPEPPPREVCEQLFADARKLPADAEQVQVLFVFGFGCVFGDVCGKNNTPAPPAPADPPKPPEATSPPPPRPAAPAPKPAKTPTPADDVIELTLSDLAREGVDRTVAATWLKVRKDKRAAKLTQLAWDAVKREAALAGMTPGDAVRVSAEMGWVGFKATWAQRAGQTAAAGAPQTALEARNAAAAAQLIANHADD